MEDTVKELHKKYDFIILSINSFRMVKTEKSRGKKDIEHHFMTRNLNKLSKTMLACGILSIGAIVFTNIFIY